MRPAKEGPKRTFGVTYVGQFGKDGASVDLEYVDVPLEGSIRDNLNVQVEATDVDGSDLEVEVQVAVAPGEFITIATLDLTPA